MSSCSLSLIFTLAAASISHFLKAAPKFLCCSSNKKCLLVCFFFLTRLALFLVELRWPVALLSLFSVFLYFPNWWT